MTWLPKRQVEERATSKHLAIFETCAAAPRRIGVVDSELMALSQCTREDLRQLEGFRDQSTEDSHDSYAINPAAAQCRFHR